MARTTKTTNSRGIDENGHPFIRTVRSTTLIKDWKVTVTGWHIFSKAFPEYVETFYATKTEAIQGMREMKSAYFAAVWSIEGHYIASGKARDGYIKIINKDNSSMTLEIKLERIETSETTTSTSTGILTMLSKNT